MAIEVDIDIVKEDTLEKNVKIDLDKFREGLGKYKDVAFGKTMNTGHDWLFEEEYVPTINAHKEGFTYDSLNNLSTRKRGTNFTQILVKVISIAEPSANVVNATGILNELQYQADRAMIELGKDFVYSMENNPTEGNDGIGNEPRLIKNINSFSKLPNNNNIKIVWLREPYLKQLATLGLSKQFVLTAELTYEYNMYEPEDFYENICRQFDGTYIPSPVKRTRQVEMPTEQWQKNIEKQLKDIKESLNSPWFSRKTEES